MADDNKIGLQAEFENSGFNKGIDEYNKDIAGASSATEEAGSVMSGVWEGMAAIGQVALTAVGAALAALATELFLAADAAMDAEEVLARVSFVTDNVSDRTGVATDEVLALADAMSMVIPIDDEVIASAIAMGLTFDGVTEDNIEPLISAAADLSEWTGKDLPASMKELSLAVSDSEKTMRLFRSANITLSDAEEKHLKQLGELGDTAGITQFILDQLTKKGILGLAEAMGDTTKGELTIMQTAIGNLQEALGTGLLDSLSSVFTRITDFANNPQIIQFFTDVGVAIGDFASEAIAKIPELIEVFDSITDWFVDNQALIIGILAAIGVAIAAFGFTVAATAISTISAMAPIIIAMVLIGAAVALLYTAWTENWGGIQEAVGEAWAAVSPIFDSLANWLSVNLPIAIAFLSDLWTNTLLPALKEVFEWISTTLIPLWISVVEWLQVNVPLAIQYLADYWTNTLLPAIQVIGEWINTNLIPVFASIVEWLQVNVPLAIQTLSAIWTGTLLPAIQAVWGWINTNLIPLFSAIAGLISAVLNVALTALAGLWQNVLLPAIQSVGNWLSATLMPILTTVGNFIQANFTPILLGLSGIITGTLMPALQPLASFLQGTLKGAFDAIGGAIQNLIGFINNLTDAFNNIELPPELTPGSPTPFEIGLKGINEQLKMLSNIRLPALTSEMGNLQSRDVMSSGGNASASAASVISSSQSVRNYLFGANFNVNSSAVFFDILSEMQ